MSNATKSNQKTLPDGGFVGRQGRYDFADGVVDLNAGVAAQLQIFESFAVNGSIGGESLFVKRDKK
ncbi:hypothetical protein V0R55_26955 [Pseudomonas soli]|uniref:Uncharacterized protein n=1 Tax=Pseudomonas soli TaxID=1306993 RepID=A0ABU7GXU2_9PSED|nr:hypothetical protein [Pseudomonas soli]MEE1883785.1 hypothetical protein [Pseudomonas soli]